VGSSVAFMNCQVKCSQQEGAVKIIATSQIKVQSLVIKCVALRKQSTVYKEYCGSPKLSKIASKKLSAMERNLYMNCDSK